jgi:hypothetical protein
MHRDTHPGIPWDDSKESGDRRVPRATGDSERTRLPQVEDQRADEIKPDQRSDVNRGRGLTVRVTFGATSATQSRRPNG